MEQLLHYVWKYRLYGAASLQTTEGVALSVIDPGIANRDAGPDFFNAKIVVDGTLWAGSVEIHDRASDWLRHHHDQDKAYDGVILHVVGVADIPIARTNGEPIPMLVLPVPSAIREQIDSLLSKELPISLRGGWMCCSVNAWSAKQLICCNGWISIKAIGTRCSIFR